MLVQLFLVFFGLPGLFHIRVTPVTAATITLSAYTGAFVYVFAGVQLIESIGQDQLEAARALGLSCWQVLRHVVAPQAAAFAIGPLIALLVNQLQVTSLISVIGVVDLTKIGNILNMRTLKPFIVWTAVGLLYYAAAKLVALLGVALRKSPSRPQRLERASDMIRVERRAFSSASTTVLDGVDLAIGACEVVSILGLSGAGKSTLIRCINGLEKLNGGRIMVDEFDVGKPRASSLRLASAPGTVFQLFNLYPHMTVLGNITLAPIEVLKKPRAEAEADGACPHRIRWSRSPGPTPIRRSSRVVSASASASAGRLPMQPRYLLLDEVTKRA